jgi:hypothetical protein
MQLERNQVDPFAQILVTAYLGAADGARSFTDEWGSPPTRMHKSHHLRSIAQARITQSDRFDLHPEYVEMGRVQVTDVKTGSSYLIRSKAAIDIEEAFGKPEQLTLFEVPRKNPIGQPYLLAYSFERGGMRLWVCATKQLSNRSRLLPAGDLEYIGLWPFEGALPPGGGGGIAFDQGKPDPFDDLGDDVDFGEAEGL